MGELKSLHHRCWPWRRFSMSQQCLLQNKRRLFPSSARRKESLSLPRRVLESRLWQLSPEETHDCHCQWPCIRSTVVHSPASSDIFRRQWFPRDQEDLRVQLTGQLQNPESQHEAQAPLQNWNEICLGCCSTQGSSGLPDTANYSTGDVLPSDSARLQVKFSR